MVILSDGSQGEIEKGERELWGWSAGDRISRDVMRQSVRGACFGVVLSPTGSSMVSIHSMQLQTIGMQSRLV